MSGNEVLLGLVTRVTFDDGGVIGRRLEGTFDRGSSCVSVIDLVIRLENNPWGIYRNDCN